MAFADAAVVAVTLSSTPSGDARAAAAVPADSRRRFFFDFVIEAVVAVFRLDDTEERPGGRLGFEGTTIVDLN